VPDPHTHPDTTLPDTDAHSDPYADAHTHPDTQTQTDTHTHTHAFAETPTTASPAPAPASSDADTTARGTAAHPAAEAEAHAHTERAPQAVAVPGELSGVPHPAAQAPAPQRPVAGLAHPAHHRARGARRSGAAPALTLEASLSEWLVLVLAMAAACVVVLIVTLVRHRAAPVDEDPSETPDVIEYMSMMIGVVYAIVLGLAIAGVWEGRGVAQDHVQTEAQALHEITERVRVYPPDVRDRIRADVNTYVSHVVHTEWKTMADQGHVTAQGGRLFDRIRQDVTDYEPKTDFEAQAYQPLVDQVTAADAARNSRADSTGATMPGVVWFGLIAGAVVTVGMVFALQIRRTTRELILAGLFSALIAFLLFLIWDFDAPYSRGITASAEPFTALFPHLPG